MLPRLICRAFATATTVCAALALALLLLLAPTPSAADDLADFNAAIEQFAAHNRVAIGYLRTNNTELATVEIDRMKAAWANVMTRFGTNPPQALRDNPRYKQTLSGIQKNIGDAIVLLNTGKAGANMFGPPRNDLVRNSLQSIREQLSVMRKESRVTVLADCVLEANGAMAAFFAFQYTVPDFSKPDVTNKANALATVIKRCDEVADADTRKNPEFRRLIDGTLNSLTFVPKVIETRDRELLERVIGELRAFDNLLLFRFG